jgi:tryptophan halogenase
MKLNKKIIVLGGGTAGWLTALFAKKFLSNNVTLIESKKIGIIGVGEGTVPSINSFLQMIDIHPYEVIAHTGGTLKNGISFERWNKDSNEDVYFHPFSDLGNFNNFNIDKIFSNDCRDYYIKELISKNLDLKDYIYSAALSYKNKVDDVCVLSALHFDTYSLGDYLSTKAEERGIKHIDGKFIDAKLDEQGFITQLRLEDDREYDCDFIFDCTGLGKEIIVKKLKEKFINYSDTLAMKKAIIIPKEEAGHFPYTRAVAMKYGWIFEIPLQHRIGRGYIYDSDYISQTQAYDEASQYYCNESIEVKKVITFEAGRMENCWVKNCMSIGLSQSFVEPLEATSIFTTTETLSYLKHYLNCFENYNEISVKNFNKSIGDMLDNIRDFIRFHYISNRDDSDFWKDLPTKYKISNYVQNLVTSMKNGDLVWTELNNCLGKFGLASWLTVGNGLNLITKYDRTGYENLKPSVEEMKLLIDNNLKIMPLMKDWLQITNENFK